MARRAKSIAEARPDLIAEWSDKNELTPYEASSRSTKIAWWKCSVENHPDFQQRVDRHVDGRCGCDICKGRKPESGQDLGTLFPELAAEWDYELNERTPSDYVPGSAHRAHWICSKHSDHKWRAEIRTRTGEDKTGCPICSNHKLLVGFNDLATKAPDIAAEWDYDLNQDSPDEILYASNSKRHWKCLHGHTWTAPVRNRTELGNSCKTCRRNQTSFIEQFIYSTCISQYGQENVLHRDCNLIGLELDVVVPSKRIAFEPGSWYWHKDKTERDTQKRQLCRDKDYRCFTIYDGVGEDIAISGEFSDDIIAFQKGMTFINYDLLKDMLVQILELNEEDIPWEEIAKEAKNNSLKRCAEEKSLGYLHPELISEWSEDNAYSPFEVSCGCNSPFEWKCTNNPKHIYSLSPSERTRKIDHCPCPYCSGRMVDVGRNDLASQYPELLKFFSPDNPFTAEEVSVGHHGDILWKCLEGKKHPDYPRSVSNQIHALKRGKGIHCPRCRNSGRRVFTGEDDLCTTHPELAKSYSKDNIREANTIRFTFQDLVFWICEECHQPFEKAVDTTVNRFNKTGQCLCDRCAKGYPSKDELKQKLRDGMAIDKIAKSLHFGPNTLRVLCDKYGIPWRQSEIKKYDDRTWESL